MGRLPCSGNGTPVAITEVTDEAGLSKGAVASNRRLLESLREDENAKALHEVCPAASLWLLSCNGLCIALFQACLKDASFGRMTRPQPASIETCERCVLAPRFSVEQGNLNKHAAVATLIEKGSINLVSQIQRPPNAWLQFAALNLQLF